MHTDNTTESERPQTPPIPPFWNRLPTNTSNDTDDCDELAARHYNSVQENFDNSMKEYEKAIKKWENPKSCLAIAALVTDKRKNIVFAQELAQLLNCTSPNTDHEMKNKEICPQLHPH